MWRRRAKLNPMFFRGLWGFLQSSKSYFVKDPSFGEVGYGCKVEATDRDLTAFPKDGLQKRLRFVEAQIDVEVMPGQIRRARLTRGKPKLSLELSDPSGLAKKAGVSIDGLPAGDYKVSHGKSSRRVAVNGPFTIDVPMMEARQIQIEQV